MNTIEVLRQEALRQDELFRTELSRQFRFNGDHRRYDESAHDDSTAAARDAYKQAHRAYLDACIDSIGFYWDSIGPGWFRLLHRQSQDVVGHYKADWHVFVAERHYPGYHSTGRSEKRVLETPEDCRTWILENAVLWMAKERALKVYPTSLAPSSARMRMAMTNWTKSQAACRSNLPNPDCCGDHCLTSTGQVRVLPTGGDGTLILCYSCYQHEMAFRRDRDHASYDCPPWDSLKVYEVNDNA